MPRAGGRNGRKGFQFGAALLQFDATGDPRFLELGRSQTLRYMAPHLTHTGVHDHGFNNLSTYGNLLRLLREGKVAAAEREADLYELALKVSGAVQAARWTDLGEGRGFIYSFNGPHSLFIDTLRSLRSLAMAHLLGHVLMGERDRPISLLQRLLAHAQPRRNTPFTTAPIATVTNVRGRVAHESVFNPTTARIGAPIPSRVIPRSPPGPAGWPGLSADSRSRPSFSRPCRKQPCASGAALVRSLARCGRPPWHRGFLPGQHPGLRRALLGHRGARSTPAGRLSGPSRRTVQRLGTGG